jgi:hypothetical protein
MARSNTLEVVENENGEAAGEAAVRWDDKDIYISPEGVTAVLPWEHVDTLTSEQNIALNIGRYNDALRAGQTIVKRAIRERKNPHAELQAFYSTFAPSVDREFSTVGEKRRELARALLIERLEASGKPAMMEGAKKLRADPKAVFYKADGKTDYLPEFQAKYGEEVEQRLNAWLAEPKEKKTRNATGAVPIVSVGEDSELDEI